MFIKSACGTPRAAAISRAEALRPDSTKCPRATSAYSVFFDIHSIRCPEYRTNAVPFQEVPKDFTGISSAEVIDTIFKC
jgi:hypothetical protein